MSPRQLARPSRFGSGAHCAKRPLHAQVPTYAPERMSGFDVTLAERRREPIPVGRHGFVRIFCAWCRYACFIFKYSLEILTPAGSCLPRFALSLYISCVFVASSLFLQKYHYCLFALTIVCPLILTTQTAGRLLTCFRDIPSKWRHLMLPPPKRFGRITLKSRRRADQINQPVTLMRPCHRGHGDTVPSHTKCPREGKQTALSMLRTTL